jgi:hypothetical protein
VKQDLQKAVTQASQYKFANPTAINSMKKATTILQAQPAGAAAHPVHVNPAMMAVPPSAVNSVSH